MIAAEPDSLRAAFEKFHAENPRVYELLCRVVDDLIGRGVQRGLYAVGGQVQQATRRRRNAENRMGFD